MKIKSKLGVVLSLIISFSPLVFWYFSLLPFQLRFSNNYSILASLGQITGLIGIAMYSVVLVLGVRWNFLNDYFGGAGIVFRWHHILGAVSLLLILLHPIFLALARGTYSMKAAAMLLIPAGDWTINIGILALLMMIAFLILTFYRTISYKIWKLSHNLLGLVFIIGTIHAFYVPSDISRFFPLKIYMFILINIGAAAYFYRTFKEIVYKNK